LRRFVKEGWITLR